MSVCEQHLCLSTLALMHTTGRTHVPGVVRVLWVRSGKDNPNDKTSEEAAWNWLDLHERCMEQDLLMAHPAECVETPGTQPEVLLS